MPKRKTNRVEASAPSVYGRLLAIAAGLVALTLIAFWNVQGNGFLSYDDPLYVTQNPYVQAGLSWVGLRGAFSEIVAANWQPVTVLSHELDVSLFGDNARGHHFTSLLIHVANVVLLFSALYAMTKSELRSGLVAAFFAVHPLHAESVAWISSRKDVLSTFFLLLALCAYIRYARLRDSRAYVGLCCAFTLGLMAKSMLMTMPFLLLLLDYWPLRRIDFTKNDWKTRATALLREKIPLFGLTAVFVGIAFYTQHVGKALQGVAVYTLYARTTNALVSYAEYALRMFAPYPLAIFYPHPGSSLPTWQIIGSVLLLLLVSIIVMRTWRTRPHLLVGWFWFVGTLVPVIGLVQIGGQAMADRYTYVPLIGLFVAIVWEVSNWLPAAGRAVSAVVGVAILIPLVLVTQWYVTCWRDTESIFQQTLRVTENNYPAHINLGCALADRGAMAEAEAHFDAATRIVPASEEGWFNLGSARMLQKNYEGALAAYLRAADVEPNDFDVRLRIAKMLHALGRDPEAARELDKALALRPGDPEAAALAKALEKRAS